MKKFLFIPFLFSSVSLLAQDKPQTKNSTSQTSSTRYNSCENADPEEIEDVDLFRKCKQVFSTHFEFLYWKTRENSLDYALEMNRPAWGDAPSYAQGDYKRANFKWAPGLRVALSFFRAPHYWELWGQYTLVNSNGHQKVTAPSESGVFLDSTWPKIFDTPVQSAQSNIRLNYNVADFYATRVYFPNPHLRMRAVGGLTSTWMDQKWKILYSDGGINQTRVQNNWDYWGVGFRGGGTADWFWTENIYFTAKTSVALLIGNYHNHALERTTFTPSDGLGDPSVPVRDSYYADTRSTYNVQFYLGPSWQKAYKALRVEVFAGYEINAWFNVLEVMRSTGSGPDGTKQTLVNSGTLSLDGLTLRLTMDF